MATRLRFAKVSAREFKPLLIWLIACLVVFLLSYPARWSNLIVTAEAQVRLAGMLLQFAGLATVVVGLSASRRLFKKSSLAKSLWSPISNLRHILFPPEPIKGRTETGGTGAFSSAGEVHSTDRVERLEQKLGHLEAAVAELRQTVRETDQRIDRESAERRSGDQDNRKQLEEAVVGGIHIELGGLAYLLIGILLTSFPKELSLWLPV